MKIGIIVLAAGSSSRLGQPKQLLKIHDKSLLEKTTETAYSCTGVNTLVVLGSDHVLHEKIISHLPVYVEINADWKKGMGNSLKAGLKKILDVNPALQAVIVMVCDQPLVTKEHLEKIIDVHNTTQFQIVASKYASTVGVPALFHKTVFDAILNGDDEHGAKKIIQSHPESSTTIEFPEGAIDLDTPGDVQAFLQNSKDRQY